MSRQHDMPLPKREKKIFPQHVFRAGEVTADHSRFGEGEGAMARLLRK